jgi:hypothetical protein
VGRTQVGVWPPPDAGAATVYAVPAACVSPMRGPFLPPLRTGLTAGAAVGYDWPLQTYTWMENR